MTGITSSTDFPTTVGTYQTSSASFQALFVTKLNPAGTAYVYSTYLAGALESKDVATAELAYWHLRRLAYPVDLPGFNAGDSIARRTAVANKVRDMISRDLPPDRKAPKLKAAPKGP